MVERPILLAGLWVAVMLIYLLGDVLRIFSGDHLKGDIKTTDFTQPMWLGISVLMVIPIVMIVVSLTVDASINRWLNIIAAGFFFVFNLFGLPTYHGWYDKFLLLVSLIFNLMTIGYAWDWAI